jgi:predicted nucleic acid-binding protein
MLAPDGLPARSNSEAWAAFDAMIGDDRIVLRRDDPAGLDAAWRRLTARNSASPALWMDGYLAAYALAAGYTLVTLDRAFRQFPGLDVLVLG